MHAEAVIFFGVAGYAEQIAAAACDKLWAKLHCVSRQGSDQHTACPVLQLSGRPGDWVSSLGSDQHMG